LPDPVRGRRGGNRLDGGANVFGLGEKKIVISTKAKKKKTSQLSRAIVGSHLRDSTLSDRQGK